MRVAGILLTDKLAFKKGTLFMRKTDTFPNFDLGFVSDGGGILGKQEYMFSSKKVIYIQFLEEEPRSRRN